jgi:hypothetical protein
MGRYEHAGDPMDQVGWTRILAISKKRGRCLDHQRWGAGGREFAGTISERPMDFILQPQKDQQQED